MNIPSEAIPATVVARTLRRASVGAAGAAAAMPYLPTARREAQGALTPRTRQATIGSWGEW
jgi:hypothetical protein